MQLERKAIEFKADSLNEDGTFTGYASVYNNVDQGGDIVVPGAFDGWLSTWDKAADPIQMLWNHLYDSVLGIFTDAKSDTNGLKVWGALDLDTQDGREKYSHMKKKAIRGMSIGYEILPGGIRFDANQDAYLLTNLKLWEVSLVTFPMNPLARVSEVKSDFNRSQRPTIRKIEKALIEQGFSRRDSKIIAKNASETLDFERRDGDLTPEEIEILGRAADRLAKTVKGIRT